jgi:hypothetical protein
MLLRIEKSWKKPVAIGAALAACVTVVALRATPVNADESHAAPAKAKRHCVRYHLTEVMNTVKTNGTPGIDVPAGFEAIWLDDMFTYGSTDAADKVGTATGNMDIIEERSSDGHDIEYQYELFHFQDGVFTAQSAFDRMDVINGTWITQPVTGLTGRYAGWTGKWTWRAVPAADGGEIPNFEDKFTLCPS